MSLTWLRRFIKVGKAFMRVADYCFSPTDIAKMDKNKKKD